MPLLENLLSQGTIERLGWTLVHFLWQAMAVALLLAVLLRLLRRAGASVRYGAAYGALALMLILPLVTMQFVEVTGPAAEAGPLPDILHAEAVEPTPAILHTVRELPPLEMTPPLETASVAVPVPLRERVVTAVEPALPYIVFGWLAGVFGLSAWHLGGWTQLHRLKHRMAREAGRALCATLDELATKLGVRRAVTLLESALVEVPTVLGWLRPVILLPTSALTGLNPDQLRAILAHELAHIRRHDYLANIAQTVVEILGFYHPAVWWVSSRIRIERENCCDDLAVQVCGNSLQYAKALTSMEEIRHSRTDLALAASGGSLMARIARLLGRPVGDDRRFAWLPGLIALLLVVGVVIPAALVLGAPATPLTTHHADLVTSDGNEAPSLAWTILRRPNCPPLLLGLTQQFAKMLEPSRQNDPAWRDTRDSGTLRLKVNIEGTVQGEVLIGLFADPRWLAEPAAIRRVASSGDHVLTGLPAGRYQIGAMVGKSPVAAMLGVQRQWPQAVEIGAGRTTTAEVLVSEAFQQWASGWYNNGVSKDYLGDWSDLDPRHLLQGRLLGPDGDPIRFGEIQIREYKDPARRQGGIAAPNVGTSEQGRYQFDGMTWPYTVAATWRDPLPSMFGCRSQAVRFNRVLEGPQQVDFQFKPFPTGTAKVAGRVTDQSGDPVEGFFLRVLTPPMRRTRSDDSLDGSYETNVMYEAPFLSEDGQIGRASCRERV